MPDLVVLCYHAVSRTWPAALSVTPANLRRQLASLVKRGYRGATFTEAVLGPPRAPTVCVTFDDAYVSTLTQALPILDELGLPGTVFAPTAYIGAREPMSWPGIDHWLDTEHRSELVPMDWDDLAQLRERGWEVGSHTFSHPQLTQIDDDDLNRQLQRSKHDLESRLGADCTSLAYPYGDYDRRVVEATHRAGYAAAAGLPTRIPAVTPLTWPRLGIYRKDGAVTFGLKVSRVVRGLRRAHGWDAAHRVVRAFQ